VSASADQAIARRAWLAGVRWARGPRASEAPAVSVAFDAWWTEVSKPSPSARVPVGAPSWWYGRGSKIGRRLYDRRGPAQHPALDTLPLDGGYAPRWSEDRPSAPRGQFKRTVVTSDGDVYTILSWWDDVHADSSSCFIVRGDQAYSSEALLAVFPLHFPGQAIQLAAAGVQLVEVAHQGS